MRFKLHKCFQMFKIIPLSTPFSPSRLLTSVHHLLRREVFVCYSIKITDLGGDSCVCFHKCFCTNKTLKIVPGTFLCHNSMTRPLSLPSVAIPTHSSHYLSSCPSTHHIFTKDFVRYSHCAQRQNQWETK